MKILLVGCGDVATEAGLRWLADGHQVTAWRRTPEKLPAGFHGECVDLTAATEYPRIDEATDIVVLTPVPAARNAEGYRRSYLQVAQRLIAQLNSQAPRLRRLLYVSSSAVLGGTDGAWVNESTELAPSRETSQVLADTEELLRTSGLPISILRASGIYGPGRTRLLDLMQGGTAVLPTGSHWTNRIHRDDLASALTHVAALDAAQDLYMVNDDEPAQLAQVYTFLAAKLGVPLPPEQHAEPTDRRGGDRRISNARLRASGWQPEFPSYREGYDAMLTGQGVRHP
ncbi:SDR family oxidoreductase [Glutamicibacter endophyticus]